MIVKLFCETVDVDIVVRWTENAVSCLLNYLHESDFDGRISLRGEDSAKYVIRRRIMELAVLREMQLLRQVDIVSFRSRLALDETVKGEFTSVVGKYRKAGVVEGIVAGIDSANGFPYKSWKIVDDAKAAYLAKLNQWPLMRPSGKSAIRERGGMQQ